MRAISKISFLVLVFAIAVSLCWMDSAAGDVSKVLVGLETGRGEHILIFGVPAGAISCFLDLQWVGESEEMEIGEIEDLLVDYGFNDKYASELAERIAASWYTAEIMDELAEYYEDGASVKQMHYRIMRELKDKDNYKQQMGWNRHYRYGDSRWYDSYPVRVNGSLNGEDIFQEVKLDDENTTHSEQLDLSSLEEAGNELNVRVRAMEPYRLLIEVVGIYPDPQSEPGPILPSNTITYYQDYDGDGYGRNTPFLTRPATAPPPTVSPVSPYVWVTLNGDCDDLDAETYPGVNGCPE